MGDNTGPHRTRSSRAWLVSCDGCTQRSRTELPWLSCAVVSREEMEGNVLAKINQRIVLHRCVIFGMVFSLIVPSPGFPVDYGGIFLPVQKAVIAVAF